MGNMDYMAAHLLSYGYNIATVDYYWVSAAPHSNTTAHPSCPLPHCGFPLPLSCVA